MKYLVLISVFVLSINLSFAQNNETSNILFNKKTSVDVSVGGNGLGLSANINRVVWVEYNYFINASIGIGTVPFSGGYSIPHQITINVGKYSSFFEVGLGGSYWSGIDRSNDENSTINSYQISPVLGWRKHFRNNMIFRVYTNPLFYMSGVYFIEDYKIVPYLGISIGYAF